MPALFLILFYILILFSLILFLYFLFLILYFLIFFIFFITFITLLVLLLLNTPQCCWLPNRLLMHGFVGGHSLRFSIRHSLKNAKEKINLKKKFNGA